MPVFSQIRWGIFRILFDISQVTFHFTDPEKDKTRNFSCYFSFSQFHRNREMPTFFRFPSSALLAWLTAVEEWHKTQIRSLGVLFRGLMWTMECLLSIPAPIANSRKKSSKNGGYRYSIISENKSHYSIIPLQRIPLLLFQYSCALKTPASVSKIISPSSLQQI